MTVSSDGADPASGILWITTTDGPVQPAPGVLRAYVATDLTQQLWDSSMVPDRDSLGSFAKFVNPTVANGKVYAAASNEVAVYGLLPPPEMQISAIVNGASGAGGGVAPGEIVSSFGSQLGPAVLTPAELTPEGTLPTSVGGAQVLFDGNPASLLYTSASQVGVIVPAAVAGANTTSAQVVYAGQMTPALAIPTVEGAPGLFTTNQAGAGPGAILNQDYTLNSPQAPAARGSIVMLYGTGGGVVEPPTSDGIPPGAPAEVTLPVAVFIGGQPADVLYAGVAPGFAGLLQINAAVPIAIAAGDAVPVVVRIGQASSQDGVTLAVQ